MEKLIINGGKKLKGNVKVSGSKNVALKALVAACLTDEEVIIENIPLISDVFVMIEIMDSLGVKVLIEGHKVKVNAKKFTTNTIQLDKGAQLRTSSLFIAPLLARTNRAVIPNPGGCRLGARPIDRLIEGVKSLGADINYDSKDGYFHAKAKFLTGTNYTFSKSTHTGTETLILAAILAKGKTILKNAAQEPEIDELIELLNKMGAKVFRSGSREITIDGVEKLHGAEFKIGPDRNEVITFAAAALVTCGDIFIENATSKDIGAFLEKVNEARGDVEEKNDGIRFFFKDELFATNVTTGIFPGFMTDWQAPWAVVMTQAKGISTIHETVFENKMGYVNDLRKMGAHIEEFKPEIEDPESIYNFNLDDDSPDYIHAVKIFGPTPLHNAILTTIDLRAGAAVVLAALAAHGESTIFGVEKLDRGYEKFEERLSKLGADIKRVKET